VGGERALNESPVGEKFITTLLIKKTNPLGGEEPVGLSGGRLYIEIRDRYHVKHHRGSEALSIKRGWL